MPGFFVDRRKVYRVEITSPPDPETGETKTAWVDLRKMTEGDIQDRQDIATQIVAEQKRQQGTAQAKLKGHLAKGGKRRGQQPPEEQEAQMRYALGALRGFDLVRSIVDWNLTDDNDRRVPPTPDNIQALDPYSATLIHNEIAYLNPSIFPGQTSREVKTELDYEDAEYMGLDYGEENREEDPLPQNEDDEIFGADEDAPPEAGGVGSRDTGAVEDPGDEEAEMDPTRKTSASRQ